MRIFCKKCGLEIPPTWIYNQITVKQARAVAFLLAAFGIRHYGVDSTQPDCKGILRVNLKGDPDDSLWNVEPRFVEFKNILTGMLFTEDFKSKKDREYN